MNEFIGHDGFHYKIVNNKIYKITHRVLRKEYNTELNKLERLPRNYNFPFLKNYERSSVIYPIRIEIIKKKSCNDYCNYLFNIFN